MARKKYSCRTLLFEELEPRLLFSADVAEAAAAEAVAQQVEEPPIVIIIPAAEQQEGVAETSDAGEVPDQAPPPQEQVEGDSSEPGETASATNDPSEPDTSLIDPATDDEIATEENSAETAGDGPVHT
ncbi:MAG: LEPR-XLL domain-containing protein, partial [Desulfofustis sp.]|nr:LEPR-XLL domain-containing protein [Desulfofustis sp.]